MIKAQKRITSEEIKFSVVINSLNLVLKDLENKETNLSSGVKKLSDDLVEAYGEPNYDWLSKQGEGNAYKILLF